MKFIFFALIFLLIQCSASLMNRHIHVTPEEMKNDSSLEAVVLKIDFRNTSSESINLNSYEIFKQSLLAAVSNSQKFEKVILAKDRVKRNPENTVYLDLIVQPFEQSDYGKLHTSDFNYWWVMWPAVHPMYLYYPIQVKSGEVEVKLILNVEFKQTKKTFRIEKSNQFDIFWYAFFRTSPIELVLEKSYLEALNEVTLKIKEIDFTQSQILKPLPAKKKRTK